MSRLHARRTLRLALRAGSAAQLSPSTQPESKARFYWMMLAATAITTSQVAHADGELDTPKAQKAHGFAFQALTLEKRRRIFFVYERKIRDLSPPHKVFEYFASQRDPQTHAAWMTADDVFRSVVPLFPPRNSDIVRSGSLWGEPSPVTSASAEAVPLPKVFAVLDLDGNGRIGFEEWLLFVAFLSLPPDEIEVAFRIVDRDSSGSIELPELEELLRSLYLRNAEMAHGHEGRRLQQRIEAGFTKLALALMESLAGGSSKLTMEQFVHFVENLRDEMVQMEFKYYDPKNKGSISGQDFASILIDAAPLDDLDELLDKVEDLPEEMAEAEITKAEFLSFLSFWRQLRRAIVALDFVGLTKGKISSADLDWTARSVLGQKLTSSQIAIVEHLFSDEHGGINKQQLWEVMSSSHIVYVESLS